MEIKFEDIREGDRIRAQFAPDYGITITGEGVAHELRYGDTWVTPEGGFLVRENDTASITLLARATPEPDGVGVVIETDTGFRLVSIHPRPGGRRWVPLRYEWDKSASDHATVWTWDALVRAYDSISVVREGV